MSVNSNAKSVVYVLQLSGPPCSGKGTMIKMLMAHFNEQEIAHTLISTSSFLRERVNSGGEYAEEIRTHMKNGTTVPGYMAASVITPAVSEFISSITDQKYIVIFDGYLRTAEQVDSIFRIKTECDGDNREVILLPAIVLNVYDDILLSRHKAQQAEQPNRTDHDQFEIRLKTYKNLTLAAINNYSEQLGVEIKGAYAGCGKDESFKNLLSALSQVSSRTL